MNDIKFINNYLEEFRKHLNQNNLVTSTIIKIKKSFLKIKKSNKKIIIIGNGGSAGIASHFSVDMTKNGKIRCMNFNESGLITCLSNDFSYEEMYAKGIDYYGDKGDLLVAISSSGTSPNIINACKQARKKGFSKHKRENWIKCAESTRCSNDCRDSNGFKTDLDIKYKTSKCVPKTRKVNPKYKPESGWSINDDEQYAYEFLKNYNSIVYTLNEYNSRDIKKDEILKNLSTTTKKVKVSKKIMNLNPC